MVASLYFGVEKAGRPLARKRAILGSSVASSCAKARRLTKWVLPWSLQVDARTQTSTS